MNPQDQAAFQALREFIIHQKIVGGKSDSYIISQLAGRGMDAEKAKIFVDLVNKEIEEKTKEDPFEKNLSNTTWMWLGFAVLIFLLWFFIPLPSYHKHYVFYSIFGASLFALFLGRFFFVMRTPLDYMYEQDQRNIRRHKYSLLMIVPAILFIIVFIARDSFRMDYAFRHDGILTTGVVKDGTQKVSTSKSLRRGNRTYTDSRLEIVMTLADGSIKVVHDNIDKHEYDMTFVDQLKPMVYVPYLPGEERVIENQAADIREYEGTRTESFETYLENREAFVQEAQQMQMINMEEQWNTSRGY